LSNSTIRSEQSLIISLGTAKPIPALLPDVVMIIVLEKSCRTSLVLVNINV
jgi:hypothetical protein